MPKSRTDKRKFLLSPAVVIGFSDGIPFTSTPAHAGRYGLPPVPADLRGLFEALAPRRRPGRPRKAPDA